jgi:hypothetical protein
MANQKVQKSAPVALALSFADAIQEIPIDKFRRDPELTSRVKGTSPKVIAEYSLAMAGGAAFPPVVAFLDPDGALWLADGFHRVAAAEAAGKTTIAAELREGSRSDAMVHAAGANGSHGFRRTTADKRRAVQMLLEVRADWSDVRIAEAARVTDKTVAAERRRLNLGNSETARTGRDGKARKARKAPKGKRGRPKAPRVVRALRPLAKILDRIGRSHPEAEAEVQRATAALLDLVARLAPPSTDPPEEQGTQISPVAPICVPGPEAAK